jgi:hypothetical protein
MQRRNRSLQPRVRTNMSRMSTFPIRRRVIFSEVNAIIYLDDDEDWRTARRGTWIMRRRIFELCIRQIIDILLSLVLHRHLFKYRVEILENKHGPFFFKRCQFE